jgi:hypothetical protein
VCRSADVLAPIFPLIVRAAYFGCVNAGPSLATSFIVLSAVVPCCPAV